MQIAGKCILITGGSSGIGSATAEAPGAKRARSLLAARRPGPLKAASVPPRGCGLEHLVP